jgi:glycerol-3-phosphate dehydrogenase
MTHYDIAIIGGGINGAGLARDAAGRGLRVLLMEQNDLASGTSSASTKLIHGGLRYLEHGAVRLVREALAEREVLLRVAPHAIRPMRFVLPHHPDMRPAWMLRLGLFAYDHLGGRDILPASTAVDLLGSPLGAPLKRRFRRAFEYSDCWVDDARLVVLNALDAAERGAVICTRARCARAERSGTWRLILHRGRQREEARARVLVNAAGPWVGQVAETVIRLPATAPVRLVKGSHIVVRRLFEHDHAYIFQNTDRRIVFAIPYESAFTLIGTTDRDFAGDPGAVLPNEHEITYLCRAASVYFREEIGPQQVVHAFAGVRSLHDDGSRKAEDVTRDYEIVLDAPKDEAPLLTIYGGKITTFRRLAEAALARLAPYLPMQPPWTAHAPLPGGDFAWDGRDALVERARGLWPFLGDAHARRLVAAYGTRLDRIMEGARGFDDLGPRFGEELTAAEVRYLMRYEWAQTAEDVLWRRSKLGLHLDSDGQAALSAFMTDETGRRAAAE